MLTIPGTRGRWLTGALTSSLRFVLKYVGSVSFVSKPPTSTHTLNWGQQEGENPVFSYWLRGGRKNGIWALAIWFRIFDLSHQQDMRYRVRCHVIACVDCLQTIRKYFVNTCRRTRNRNKEIRNPTAIFFYTKKLPFSRNFKNTPTAIIIFKISETPNLFWQKVFIFRKNIKN